jgi:hypothetical protein
VIVVNTGYPLRLYASPLRLIVPLVASLVFGAIGYLMVFNPGAQSGSWNTAVSWSVLIFFGLGFILFGTEFALLVVARRPLLEVTPERWRYRLSTLYLKKASASWQEIGHIGMYLQRTGRSSATYIVLIRTSEALRAAIAQGTPAIHLQEFFAGDAQRIPLTLAYFRVTPTVCERLLADIRAVCANEINRYGVYIEPKVQRV